MVQNRYVPPNKDEKIFVAKICDLFEAVQQKNVTRTSMFLDERQQELCSQVAYNFPSVPYTFCGGYGDAQRKMLCVFSLYEDIDTFLPPFEGVTFLYRKQDKLTHRDFLGSLMGLQIKRESVGDILIEDGRAVAFVHNAVLSVVHSDMQQVGRVGIKCIAGFESPLPVGQKYQDITGTVMSLRLDSVLSLLMQISREKASEIIESEAVTVNAVPTTNRSLMLVQGDKIAVRGFGKAILDTVGNLTKKNRVHILCKKFL